MEGAIQQMRYCISVICKTDGGELAGEVVVEGGTAQDKHRGDSIPVIQGGG